MKTKMLIILTTLLLLPTAGSAEQITIECGVWPADPIGFRLGHNCAYYREAGGLWDTGTEHVKTQALSAIQHAGTLGDGLVRFPGGNAGEDYGWRRGVGDIAHRPLDAGYQPNQHFGTDELMKFIADMNSDQSTERTAKPLISVNWWYFFNPVNVANDPDLQTKGAQEAANWVEYCNGSVDEVFTYEGGQQMTALQRAAQENWVPSAYVDPLTGLPSTAENAKEKAALYNSAGRRRNWLSYEAAPTGYFAWLRYYFAVQRGLSDTEARVSYDVKYWEIGNEVYKYRPSDKTRHQFAEQYTAGVIAYSTAMKAKDYTIKVGALLDNNANMATYDSASNTKWTLTQNPGVDVDWDQVVIDGTVNQTVGGSLKAADFLALHMGVGGYDERYASYVYGLRNPLSGLAAAQFAAATEYTFRIRAAGTPATGTNPAVKANYPRMDAFLVPVNSAGAPSLVESEWVGLQVKSTDPRRYNETNEVWVCHNADAPDEKNTYITGGDGDYIFTASIPAEMNPYGYVPYVRMTNNDNDIGHPDDGRRVSVRFLFRKEGTGGAEELMEFRKGSDQTLAVMAAAQVLAKRAKAVKDYAKARRSDIELGITEFCYAWSDNGQTRSYKGALFIADLLRELIKGGDADFGGYWCMYDDGLYGVTHPKGNWSDLWGKLLDPDREKRIYYKSPISHAYHLFTNYLGQRQLTVSDNAGTFPDPSPVFDGIPAITNVPLLGTLATGNLDASSSYLNKVYLMVVNKQAVDKTCSVKLNGLRGDVTALAWHTLTCANSVDLDALNESINPDNQNSPDRITIQTEVVADNDVPELDINWSWSTENHTFPAYTATVMELDVSPPQEVANIAGIYDLLQDADPQCISLQNVEVTALFDANGDDEADQFFIEDDDRTAGVSVTATEGVALPETLSVGDRVDVSAWLTSGTVMQLLYAESVGVVEEATPTIHPILIGNRDLGGASPTEGNLLPSVPSGYGHVPADAPGVYNVGLLVQVVGRVTYVDATNHWFYVDDGANLEDGSGNTGVRVNDVEKSHTLPDVGAYVVARGISSAFDFVFTDEQSVEHHSVEREVLWIPEAAEAASYDISSIPQSGQSPAGQFQDMLMSSGETMDQIDSALAQVDGTQVSLQGVEISGVLQGYFGVKDMLEVVEGNPRLLVSRTSQVLPRWSVDVQGTITTLASGQRAIVPASVWLYTDAQGHPAPPYACMMGPSWPHKQQIQ